MYLEEIILDGFKSYANRTVISGFHPKFNAISGANGTGKSNILDGICFVMGIKSLTQVNTYNKMLF
jgi:structural maintenance of chromosome 2